MNKSGNMIQIDTKIVGKFHFHKYYWFSKILENSPNKSSGTSNSSYSYLMTLLSVLLDVRLEVTKYWLRFGYQVYSISHPSPWVGTLNTWHFLFQPDTPLRQYNDTIQYKPNLEMTNSIFMSEWNREKVFCVSF